ncbi:MAG: S-methyl-5'-thioadenosine phosphorylase [Anaerolineaceae bacterium]|nr:S-methyl-5'-thioadenosine phosphorylase [Anaerolineaceae bacterium]
MTEQVSIGVIGGTGLYEMQEISDRTTVSINTPFGAPSADIVIGTLRGKRVAFLPRHGVGHVHSPSTVPYRANIYALKSLGVRFIVSVNACGSLKEDYAPGHIVVPDQIFDHTRLDRGLSFFDQGLVAHVSVADPFCNALRDLLATAVETVGGTIHKTGTFIIIEGPRFSTRGESHIYRQWGCSIIGMTACPEAFLAREAEIAYASLAHITDYDVWHTTEKPVTAEAVIATMHHNVAVVQQALAEAIEKLDVNMTSEAHTVLDSAIMAERAQVPDEVFERIGLIIQRRFAE